MQRATSATTTTSTGNGTGTDDGALPTFSYLFDADFGENAPELLRDFEVPALFPRDEADCLAFLSENAELRPRFRWFLLSAPGSGFTMHQDPFDTSAWNAMVSGRKRWLLLPERIPHALVLPRSAAAAAAAGADDSEAALPPEEANAAAWFQHTYPSLRERAASEFGLLDDLALGVLEFEQRAGDLVFIPRGWWHCALTLPSSSSSDKQDPEACVDRIAVAVTQNYMSVGSFEVCARRMAARGRVEAARAWCARVKTACADANARERATALLSELR